MNKFYKNILIATQKAAWTVIIILLFNINHVKSQNVDSLVSIVEKYVNNNDFDSAFYYIDIAKKKYKGTKTDSTYVKILSNEGSIYLALSDYVNAVKYFAKAINIAEEINDSYSTANIKSELAIVYYETNELKKAQKYISEAYKIMQDKNMYDIHWALNYGVIMLYSKKDNYDETIKYFLNQKNKIPKTNDHINNYYNNYIGHIYNQYKKYKLSTEYFKKALTYSYNGNDSIAISMNYTGIAQNYIKLGMTDSAFFYINKAVYFAQKVDHKFALKDAYGILADIYYKKNDIKNYKKANEKLIKIKKYFFGKEIKIAIARTEYKNKILLLEKENLLKNSKIKIQFFVFTSISIILLLVLFILIKRNKYKKVISEQQIKILREKEKNAKILNDKLHNDIKSRAKELISKTIMITTNDEMQKNILKNLEEIKTDDELAQLKINNIIKDIKINSKNIWDDFFMYFNDIHKDFLSYLEKNYPDLTPTEKKITTLIKLNLTTKEISQITYSSRRTVEKHRQNIRKKMSLDNNINLQEYIIKMKTSS